MVKHLESALIALVVLSFVDLCRGTFAKLSAEGVVIDCLAHIYFVCCVCVLRL